MRAHRDTWNTEKPTGGRVDLGAFHLANCSRPIKPSVCTVDHIAVFGRLTETLCGSAADDVTVFPEKFILWLIAMNQATGGSTSAGM